MSFARSRLFFAGILGANQKNGWQSFCPPMVRAERQGGTFGHGESCENGGVSNGDDGGPRILRPRIAADQLQRLVWLPVHQKASAMQAKVARAFKGRRRHVRQQARQSVHQVRQRLNISQSVGGREHMKPGRHQRPSPA